MNRYAPPASADREAQLAPRCGAGVELAEAGIAVTLGEHRFLLTDGRIARQALSCVIAPEVGDKVLVGGASGADCYVLHVLQRADPALAELSVPGATELRIRQARLALHARDALGLHSLRDIEIGAATGLLSLHADNMFTTVNEALVQSMRHYVGSAEQYLLDVSQLLRMHGKQAMLHADQDVKVDGQRISVG